MVDANGLSVEELLTGRKYTGPYIFLRQEMKKMNEDILPISEPAEPYIESSERENNDSKSLLVRKSMQVKKLVQLPAGSGRCRILNSLLKEKLP